MNVIRSLATLAYYNTKATFARQQLIVALKIVQHGDIAVDKMNGSWAGAMGHTQFIPTTYQMFAVDYDGDGKRNIWSDVPDALASTANYLRHANWQPGQTWGYEVTLPKGFNPKKVSDKTLKRLADWQKLGFTRVGGEPFPRPGDKASLLAPAGTNGPAFLVLNNFRSILHYNVSTSYALGVGHLSDRLKGSGPFVHPWPTDAESSRAGPARRAAKVADGQGPSRRRRRRRHRTGDARSGEVLSTLQGLAGRWVPKPHHSRAFA